MSWRDEPLTKGQLYDTMTYGAQVFKKNLGHADNALSMIRLFPIKPFVDLARRVVVDSLRETAEYLKKEN